MIKALLHLGLTEKEAKVYLLLLKVGASPASSLAKRLQMKRATIYSTLQALEQKALVSFLNEEGCRRYLPHDPQRLLYELEQESIKIKTQIREAKELVSRLSELKPSFSEQSHFLLYKGKDLIDKLLLEFTEDGPVYILTKTEKLSVLRGLFPFARIKTLARMGGFTYLLIQKNTLFLVLEGEGARAMYIKSSPYVEILTDLIIGAYF